MSDKNKLAIKDLMDFYKKWPHLKKQIVDVETNIDMPDDGKEILHWLIQLADRVGKSDLRAE